jgi:hypothetical protein
MIGPRLFPEHFQVLYLQLTYGLLSQAVNFAPHGCVLASLCFSHFSSLCSFARTRESLSCLYPGPSMAALCFEIFRDVGQYAGLALLFIDGKNSLQNEGSHELSRDGFAGAGWGATRSGSNFSTRYLTAMFALASR